MEPRRGAVCVVLCASLACHTGLAQYAQGAPSDATLVDAIRQARVLRAARNAEQAHLILSAEILTAADGPELPTALAEALLELADLDLDLWHVDEASQHLSEASHLQPAARTRLVEVRARIARVQGDYSAALTLWKEALEERRREPRSETRRLLDALAATAEAHWFTGDLIRAESLFAEALTLAEVQPSPDNLAFARALKDVALLAEARGEMDVAEGGYRRSLELIRAEWGASHPGLAPRWISIGNLALLREDLLTADAAYEEAAAILDPLTDRSLVSDKAALALNWGSLDARLGRVERAREQLERARALWTETRGPAHPHLAWVSESLSEVLADAGRLEEAGDALADARARRDRAMPGSPQAVQTTVRLAALRARAGRTAEARTILREAEAGARRLTAPGAFFEAGFAARRAEAYEALGDLVTAGRLRSQAESLLAAELPDGHPLLADARGQRARIAWRAGRRTLARQLATDAWRTQRHALVRTAAALPEADALRYVERSRELRDLMLCSAADAPSAALTPIDAAALMEELAASRALVAGVVAHGSGDQPETVRAARARYASLLWQPASGLTQDYASELAAARRTLEDAERKASRTVTADVAPAARPIRPPLGTHDALVSFGRYRCPGTTGAAAREGYLAFVRAGTGPVRTIRWTDGSGLDQSIASWYAAVTAAMHAAPTEAQDDLVAARGHDLSQRLWRPLADALGATERVFIVPDGALHAVSWYALPGTNGSFLIDEAQVLHVLAAESDLATTPLEPARSVVIMADPSLKRGTAPPAGDAQLLRSACTFADPDRLPRLEQAADEAQDVRRSAEGSGRPVEAATGADATESWLRTHAPSAGILHIAAHGGVLSPESCREPTGAEGETERVRKVWEAAVRARPLMRSGLLLSGAAGYTPLDAPGADDDGILVAEEASRLDLRQADWVVLSACSTRRGPVVDAEGALGLHRAFHAAGARTVIASLWDVQDAPARRFMQALYTARLRDGKSTAEAMRDAQRAVLNDLRASGRSTHPVQWAAFVASGDWR